MDRINLNALFDLLTHHFKCSKFEVLTLLDPKTKDMVDLSIRTIINEPFTMDDNEDFDIKAPIISCVNGKIESFKIELGGEGKDCNELNIYIEFKK